LVRNNPFAGTFTFTLAGLFFFVTGVIGWKTGNHNPIFVGGQWVEGPVWSQVGIGLGCLAIAAIAFRFASRDPRLRR
jgi:hypothetical protein